MITILHYHLAKMDCPSEEAMIRSALSPFVTHDNDKLGESSTADLDNIEGNKGNHAINDHGIITLNFDLAARTLVILLQATGEPSQMRYRTLDTVHQAIKNLRLGDELMRISHVRAYHIPQMDCPSEEALIRSALEDIDGIYEMDIVLATRSLYVRYEGASPITIHAFTQAMDDIDQRLTELRLGAVPQSLTVETIPPRMACMMAPSGIHADMADIPQDNPERQRHLLWTVLLINAGFFLIEMVAGIWARSMGLVADSLDMLADSIVYGLSLWAVGHTVVRKKQVAKAAGWLQIALAILGFMEVIRRVIGTESQPDVLTMIGVASLALCANALCLYLLSKDRSKEAHLQASQIFTSNDILINLGVIASAVLVYATGSALPDLVIGAVVFILVLSGARRILQLSR